ncbi:MAG: hypothetical protein ACLFP8_00280 [Alphaproteobacteria bacterium]
MSIIRNTLVYGLLLPDVARAKPSRRDKLTNIIHHANEHCPYYKGKYTHFLNCVKDFTQEEFNYAFDHLPIIHRNDLAAHSKQFQPETLKNTKNLLENGNLPPILTLIKNRVTNKDFAASVPLNAGTSRRWINRHDAGLYTHSILRAMKKNGWQRSQRFASFMPQDTCFTSNLSHYKHSLKQMFGYTPISYTSLTKGTVEKLLKELKKTRTKMLLTAPGTLLRVAQIMKEENIGPYPHLPAINLSGSPLLDCNKNIIMTMFPESDIQCSYGAKESGIIAHQSSLKSFNYDVFDDLVYLEQGAGNTILLTTYWQESFPLIRYNTGDVGRIVTTKDGKQKIKSLEGRQADHIIGADGYMYYPSFFNMFINEINKALNDPIIDFKLRYGQIKGAPQLHLNFVLIDHSHKEKIKKTALDILQPVFSNYTHITIAFPNHIDHNATSKHKIIEDINTPLHTSGYDYVSQKEQSTKQWYSHPTREQDIKEQNREKEPEERQNDAQQEKYNVQ